MGHLCLYVKARDKAVDFGIFFATILEKGAVDFLAGSGEMAALMRVTDWTCIAMRCSFGGGAT
jgi:hypothetical protein